MGKSFWLLMGFIFFGLAGLTCYEWKHPCVKYGPPIQHVTAQSCGEGCIEYTTSTRRACLERQ